MITTLLGELNLVFPWNRISINILLFSSRSIGHTRLAIILLINNIHLSKRLIVQYWNRIWDYLRCTVRETDASIWFAEIVSVNRPWPASTCSYLAMWKEALECKLGSNKFVIADRAYLNFRFLQPPGKFYPKTGLEQEIRAWLEVVNKRLKQ